MAATIADKKIKISKNRKKYWKKHVNLKDVEEYLEEKRQEERFGGPISEKPDEELFLVANRKTTSTVTEKAVKGRIPPLRCFQMLLPDSAVPPPMKPPQLQGQSTTVKVAPKWAKPKRSRFRGTPKSKIQQESYDLWTSQENRKESSIQPGVDIGFLPDQVTRTTVKVPEYRYQKPSLLPAVEVPHPGASYNPTFEQHQDLLMSAHEIEVKRKKEEDHLDRVLTKKFPKQAPTEAAWIEEMSIGLFEETEENEENEESSPIVEDQEVNRTKTWGKPVSFQDYKSKQDRNLDKVRKREKRKVALERIQKRRINDLNSIKKIKKDINKAEVESQNRQRVSERLRAAKMFQPRRISRHKFVPADQEIKLGEELPDSLRTLTTEGDLLEDRYKSFQKRNIIEPRVRQKIKKQKMKVYVKRSHRD